MRNEIAVYMAQKLKDYCESEIACVECPFCRGRVCELKIPSRWNLNNEKGVTNDFSGKL